MINSATAIAMVAAFSVCAYAILTDPAPVADVPKLPPIQLQRRVEFSKVQWKNLLAKRLQGPAPAELVKASNIESATQTPAIRWPGEVTVQSIMFGDVSNTTLRLDQTTKTCREGQKFKGVLVEEIGGGFVVVSFQGEKKTLKKIY